VKVGGSAAGLALVGGAGAPEVGVVVGGAGSPDGGAAAGGVLIAIEKTSFASP
jgi:hypothetical protein